jgi:translocation and assembly module TamA
MQRLFRSLLIAITCLLLPDVTLAAASLHFIVKGVSADISKNIQARLEIESKALGNNPGTADIRQFYAHSTDMVKEAISPYGYFNPDVTSSLAQRGDQWTAVYHIQPGKPVIIREVNLQLSGPGSQNPNLLNYKRHFPILTNTIFTAEGYSNAKNHWLEIANNQGFIKAEYTMSRAAINTRTLSARITLHLTTGERYYVGHLLFNKTPYSDEFLQRFDVFKPNAPFSSNRLIKYQQRP